MIVIRDKEMENAEKQIRNYQKEIATLKLRLESQSGFEKVIELENKVKEYEKKTAEQQREIKALKGIQKVHEKELVKVLGEQEYEKKIKELSETLKTEKARIRELEKKLTAESVVNAKLHNYMGELQEKCNKLKETKAKVIIKEEKTKEESDKEYDMEVLQNCVKSLRKQLEKERAISRKAISELQAEIAKLDKKLEEAEYEKRVNAFKLKKVSRGIDISENSAGGSMIKIRKGRMSKTPMDVLL